MSVSETVVEIFGNIFKNIINLVEKYITSYVRVYKKKKLWKKILKEACQATEEINKLEAEIILNSHWMMRYFKMLIRNEKLNDIYYSLILSIACELSLISNKEYNAISLGMAVLDKWFEKNGIDYTEFRTKIKDDKIVDIVKDRERLYREFFLLYNDSVAKDTIRVYYPKNGENYVCRNKECSVDIKTNLTRGIEYGFIKRGIYYCKVIESDQEVLIKGAYVYGDREFIIFDYDNIREKNRKFIWLA